ncbi:MAG: hypothetical protein RBT16_08065 [Desulfococcus multivorans]|jgi:CRISPR-associated endonuclease/helicase Cas3|nr:hypothetical protein [Desulfococcus multivorans]
MNYWGRIFFEYDDVGRLISVKGQPLENHVGNSRYILAAFSSEYFYPPTRDRLLQAAERHDDGKKDTFQIIDNHKTEKKHRGYANGKRFSYSFAGHRFRVPGKDPYIDGLIRSHHEFSVAQINREKSKFPDAEKPHFADDLYLLCMADQLEAELAVKTVQKTDGDLPRTFMEFVTRRVADAADIFTVVPWPFETEALSITLALRTPRLEALSTASAKEIKHAFEHGDTFDDETLTITLWRQ